MDVLITQEAGLEIRSLDIIRPACPAWGFLLGHILGGRFFVEKILAPGSAEPGTAARRFRRAERLWPDRIIGLYTVGPGAGLKRAVLAPFFYGKLFLELRALRGRFAIRPFVVGFEGRFRLDPLPLAAPAKGAEIWADR